MMQSAGNWAPTISYKKKLKDVANQLTPAHIYREKIQNTRKETRLLQRLEQRWNRKYELWTKLWTRVQACYRGFVKRRAFIEQKAVLKIKAAQKLAYKFGLSHFKAGEIDAAITSIDQTPEMTLELLILKARILYTSGRLDDCIETSIKIKEMNSLCEEGYYFHSSSLANQQKYMPAYEEVQQLMANIDHPHDYAYKLKGFLCTKIHPPAYREAVETYDAYLKLHPEDLNAYLQRACFLNCIQEWDRVLEDIDMVVYYQPHLVQIYLLRARVYACKRMWDKAKADYNLILSWYPDNEAALSGLQDISQPGVTIPLSDEGAIYDDT